MPPRIEVLPGIELEVVLWSVRILAFVGSVASAHAGTGLVAIAEVLLGEVLAAAADLDVPTARVEVDADVLVGEEPADLVEVGLQARGRDPDDDVPAAATPAEALTEMELVCDVQPGLCHSMLGRSPSAPLRVGALLPYESLRCTGSGSRIG